MAAGKKNSVVRNYYILPCCLLLLNLCNTLISYKAGVILDPYLRTAVVILLVIFGSSAVAFVIAPGLEMLVRALHRSSQQGAGKLGEMLFLLALGGGVFWLYFEVCTVGPQGILPTEWLNAKH